MKPKYSYYKGWSLVTTDRGVFVNSVLDVNNPPVRVFDCIDCAMDWVDEEVDK